MDVLCHGFSVNFNNNLTHLVIEVVCLHMQLLVFSRGHCIIYTLYLYTVVETTLKISNIVRLTWIHSEGLDSDGKLNVL